MVSGINNQVKNCFKKVFNLVRLNLGNYINNKRDKTEDDYTSKFMDILEESWVEERLNDCLGASSDSQLYKISIGVKRHPRHYEGKYSKSDIGIVLEISSKEQYVVKAILVQAKVAKDSLNSRRINEFKLTEYDPTQNKRLHDKTSSSYYFIYAPSRIPNNKFKGISVISTVELQGFKKSKPSLADLKDAVFRFETFLVDIFIACATGDSKEETIKLARAQKNDDVFSADYTVEITVKSKLQ